MVAQIFLLSNNSIDEYGIINCLKCQPESFQFRALLNYASPSRDAAESAANRGLGFGRRARMLRGDWGEHRKRVSHDEVLTSDAE